MLEVPQRYLFSHQVKQEHELPFACLRPQTAFIEERLAREVSEGEYADGSKYFSMHLSQFRSKALSAKSTNGVTSGSEANRT